MLFIFSTLVLIRCPWQLKTVVFLHRCIMRAVMLYDTIFFKFWNIFRNIFNFTHQTLTNATELNKCLSLCAAKFTNLPQIWFWTYFVVLLKRGFGVQQTYLRGWSVEQMFELSSNFRCDTNFKYYSKTNFLVQIKFITED